MASANDWISFLQDLGIQRTLVRQNSIYLPTELKMEILESLPGVDIARVSCVCSEFRNLASDNDLWKQKCLEEFPGFVSEEAEELIAVDLVVDWKDKFVEYWRRNKQKEGTSVRRSVVSCKPYIERGFSRARDWDRGSGSTPISALGRQVLRTLVRQNSMYLPTELKMEILESLPGVDIARVSCVCSEFRNLASDNDLWKQKCLEKFAGFVTEEAEEELIAVDWKAKFVEYWRRNKQKERTIARRSVFYKLAYNDDKVVSIYERQKRTRARRRH